MRFYIYGSILFCYFFVFFTFPTFVEDKSKLKTETIVRNLYGVDQIKARFLEILIDHSIQIYNILPDSDKEAKRQILDFCKRKWKLVLRWYPQDHSEFSEADWQTFIKVWKERSTIKGKPTIQIPCWHDGDRSNDFLYLYKGEVLL